MKKVVHISDLHFGKVDNQRTQPLLNIISDLHPDIVVISGDFTQRASEQEFVQAQDFIQQIKFPVFTVPGNHDIPLFNLYRRFKNPFELYKKYISPDLDCIYSDDEIALIGINTVRNFTITSGKIGSSQLNLIQEKISHFPSSQVKIVVCHHPFDLPIHQKNSSSAYA